MNRTLKRWFAVCLALVVCAVPVRATETEEKRVVYRCGTSDDKRIALTFDDGPHPYYTAEILSILAEYQIKATFFFVGENIRYYPEAAQEVIRAGHEVGNHTYTHHRVRAMNHAELLREMDQCDEAIYEIDEYQTRLFRPPEGAFDDDVEKTAAEMEYSVILWSVDTRDWDHTAPDVILKNVLTNVGGGDIILMHDYIGHNSPTPEALKMLIPALLDKGYRFVTVSELIGRTA